MQDVQREDFRTRYLPPDDWQRLREQLKRSFINDDRSNMSYARWVRTEVPLVLGPL
jgi:hypothetical protein